MTAQTIAILEFFLAEPERQRYGLEIANAVGLKSGVLYPALHRLHEAGWLEREHEQVDPREVGRPSRKLYRLTPLGQTCALARIDAYRKPTRDKAAWRREAKTI
ncbi:MAG: PadR family transcriptional regulator [Solirubrobacteraceae bacterium]